MNPRHFCTLTDLTAAELHQLINRAIELKRLQQQGIVHEPLRNKVLAMIFEKSSTRTRVSFEVAMTQLGGNAIFLSPRDTQLGRGEPIADSARVLSRMVDCIMIRTFQQETVEIFAQHSRVPVINGLTDQYHPCQLLADMQTYIEQRGPIQGKTVAWIGDGNNMCHSYIHAAHRFDFRLRIATPAAYPPDPNLVAKHHAQIEIVTTPEQAVMNADLVVTDVWASMGQEAEQHHREQHFKDYRVTEQLLQRAAPGVLFMHCLPAHRGEEADAAVIDGPHSVVWDEAENRLHSQKALLEWLLRP